MGMWDFQPWINDEAADWYAGLFVAENFEQCVHKAHEKRLNR
ncbi:hypothetical protein [Bremerella alba]|uniref:Uncharacterized protein n=1 Tax=Bremerella alba TaxID=980252 RepID=A0A7V8V492_9BACT|nr:hypothetical protein [Bremerella alba]MBA2114506.1 hypothetical protein [Bremerella alba]